MTELRVSLVAWNPPVRGEKVVRSTWYELVRRKETSDRDLAVVVVVVVDDLRERCQKLAELPDR